MSQYLQKLYLSLTNRCNAQCEHCDLGSRRQSSWTESIGGIDNSCSRESLEYLVAELMAFDLPIEVYVTGGEPLLQMDLLFDCLVEILPEPHSISLVTNGTNLSEFVSRLKRARKGVFKTINLSLDGPPGIHEQIRRLGTAWQWENIWSVTSKLLRLQSTDKSVWPKVRINTVILPSYYHYLCKFIDSIMNTGCQCKEDRNLRRNLVLDLLHFQYQAQSGIKSHLGRNQGYQWIPEQIKELPEVLKAVREKCRLEGLTLHEFPEIANDTDIMRWYSPACSLNIDYSNLRCTAARYSLQVIPGGKVIFNTHCYEPYRFMYSLGNTKQRLRSAYEDFVNNDRRSYLDIREECHRCCMLYQLGLKYPPENILYRITTQLPSDKNNDKRMSTYRDYQQKPSFHSEH